MGKLVRYMDEGKADGWSCVDLENGDPIWIYVAQTGVVVKKSRRGLMGPTLYEESNLRAIAATVYALDGQIVEYLTPKAMVNPMLRAFTQAALECTSAVQFLGRLYKARGLGQTRDWMSDEDKEKAEIRKQIISEYGYYIATHPLGVEIRDVSELPYPKQEILDALTLEIALENDDKRVSAMIICGMALAKFQDNVGPKPLQMWGSDISELEELKATSDIDKVSLIMSNFLANEKYFSLCEIASEERASIYKKLMAAKELRRQMPETKRNAISEYEITTGSATEKGFFGKLANGDFGLAKTYWLYGVVVSVAANIILKVLALTGSIGELVIFIPALMAYQILLLMGTWRAADKYQGEKIWAILAKISVVLGAIATILLAIGLLAIIGQIIGRLNRA